MKKNLLHCMAAAVMLGFQESFAQVKYGAIITDMKGKAGGHVFKGTTAGGVMQSKASPLTGTSASGKLTKADAGRVIRAQANTAENATTWRDLSSAQQLAWTAAAPNFPFYNKFGMPYVPSGYQLYMSVNNNMLNIGEAKLTAPPSPSELTPTPAFTIATGVGPALLMLDGDIPLGYKLVLYATSNQSTGRSLEKGRLKAIGIYDDPSLFPLNITAQYVNVYGSVPSGGNFWFEGKLTKADAGRQSVPYRVQFQN